MLQVLVKELISSKSRDMLPKMNLDNMNKVNKYLI